MADAVDQHHRQPDELQCDDRRSDERLASIDAMSGEGIGIRSVLFGDSSGNLYAFGQAQNDDGTDITWHFEHGWQAPRRSAPACIATVSSATGAK